MTKNADKNLNKKKSASPYIITVVVVFLIGLGIWQFYKYKIARQGIDKMVTEKSRGLYLIHYNDLVIDEVAGSMHVKNVEIIPDTAVYNQMVQEKTNPATLIKITIPSLNVSGVKTPKALFNKEIEADKIEIDNASVEILINGPEKSEELHNPVKDVYKQLLGKLLRIKMDRIQVSHASVVVRNMPTSAIVFRSNNVSLLLSDLLIDSLAAKDDSRILFSKNVDLSADELLLPSKNKKYRVAIEKLRFLSADNSFSIGKLGIIPQLPEQAFAASFPTQKDRYDFMLEDVKLLHLNREAIWHQRIEADSLIISHSSFKIYRDLSYPRDTLSRVGNYPQQQLQRLSFPLRINKIVFAHSFIEYKEKNAKSDSAGKVQFYQVYATMTNATNISSVIASNNKCTLAFTAKFLNKATVHANLVMLLKDHRGTFFIKGDIGTINALALNPLTQPMGLARMEKGTIHSVNFNFTGTDSTSRGKLIMRYDDVKISLLKKDKRENKYARKFLPSLAADVLMKKSNPGKDGSARIAEVNYDRNLNKSFFNLIWKSIFTGIKQSVGMK